MTTIIKKISAETLRKLTVEAIASPRKRKNLNLHEELSDSLQRLLNAIEPGTYLQPHKHENPDKRELFIILKGKALVVIFTPEGEISDHFLLDPLNGKYAVEIPAGVWHTVISMEHGTVFIEVKDGPYTPLDDKNFASWAPPENHPDCESYTNGLLKKLGYA